MKKNFRFLASLAISVISLLVLVTGCGTQFGGNYTGSWSGTAGGTQITQTTFSMTLYQSGSTVSGTWLAQGGNQAPIAGQFTGTSSGANLAVSFSIPQLESYAGTYTGNLLLTGGTLTGTITGTSSQQQSVQATLQLTQQR